MFWRMLTRACLVVHPAVLHCRPSGRVTVIKAPWEPPLKESQSPQEIQDPVLVDYWHGSAANVAYGMCRVAESVVQARVWR